VELIEPIDYEADDLIDALLALLLARSIMSQHRSGGCENRWSRKASATE